MAYRYQYTLCEHLPPLFSFVWQAAISLRKLIVTLTHFFLSHHHLSFIPEQLQELISHRVFGEQ